MFDCAWGHWSSEQQEQRTYQVIYYTYLHVASGDDCRTYTPSVKRVVEVTVLFQKNLPLS